MMSVSFVKEAIIATITAAVVIPLLWLMGAAVVPSRDTHSPGLDLVVLTLAGAGVVMLIRSVWRDTAGPMANRDHFLDGWERCDFGDSFGSRSH
jgi:hypothetical protein